MAKVIRSKTAVVKSQKKVKEEIVRMTTAAIAAASTEQDGYIYGGSAGQHLDVRIGECIELLSMGVCPSPQSSSLPSHQANLQDTKIRNRDNTQWNIFRTALPNNIQLPFNGGYNFERALMSWGYKSFLHNAKDVAPTLKLPEGDQLKLSMITSTGGATTVAIPSYFVVRRYLNGSDVDYKHFDQYDGGLKSGKWFYNDVQDITATSAGIWTRAWQLQLLRNEAYKFFTGGIRPDVDNATGKDAPTASRMLETKITIDHPTIEFNKYYTGRGFNQLPFVTTSSVQKVTGVATAYYEYLEHEHRFSPTIDIVKDRNKDLNIYCKDDGNNSGAVIARMTGSKYQR